MFSYTAPFLCYNYDDSKGCLELNYKFLNARKWLSPQVLASLTKKKQRKVAKNSSVLKIQNELPKTCSSFKFKAGEWHISNPLEFNANCKVTFEAGATLKFSPNNYMILNSSPIFEAGSNPVKFTALQNEWGGFIIRGARDVQITNAIFEKSNEFMVGSRRFTGALTILNSQTYIVQNSSFINNYGDDGLNIKGGVGEIRENLFVNNRDAIDVDLGKSTIKHNLILESKDDGVDSGTARLTIVKNVIFKSGDKGVSVGEQSTVQILENIIKNNNVGIAVKDNSKAKMDKNYFEQNKIALNIYNKRLSSFDSKNTVLKGKSFFTQNDINFKYNKVQQDHSKMQQPLAEEFKSLLFKKINESCITCKQEAGRINI